MLDARKAFESAGDRIVFDARSARDRGRGGRVLTVVHAGHPRLRGQRILVRELDAWEPEASGTTAVCARSKIRSFAARYASNVPWRSRWSGSKISSTATSQASSWTSSSSKRGELADHPVGRIHRCQRPSDVAGDDDRAPGLAKIAASGSTVVVARRAVTPTNRLSGSSR